MLYIMRHGKTDWNERRKLQGRTDIPLNAAGRAMAGAAHKEYANVHLDVCYTSPLLRARETAEILLSGRNIPIIADDRLTEMSFGICEGLEDRSLKPDNPINELFHHPERYTAPVEGAESLDELFLRTGDFLRDVVIPQLDRRRDILIVGHGAMNSALICQMCGLPRKDFWSAGLEQCKLLKV